MKRPFQMISVGAIVVALGTILISCKAPVCPTTTTAIAIPFRAENTTMMTTIDEGTITRVIGALVMKLGQGEAGRIQRGVRQAASRWRDTDGTPADFEALCLENMVATGKDLDALFNRFQDNAEQIMGHLHELGRYLREPTDLDRGPVRPVDGMFASFELSSHVVEDMFTTRIAFAMLLNFELSTLEQLLAYGEQLSREQWAQTRAVQWFEARVPAEVSQKITTAFVSADAYISDYNIHMHHVLQGDGTRPFPAGLKLISHWGLRDELKSQYGQEGGLARQRLIQDVMLKIIAQEIPAVVVDNPHVDWVVQTGFVIPTASPDDPDGRYDHKKGLAISPAAEPDTRYAKWLEIFHAVRLEDPFHPDLPTYIDRKFNAEREIPKGEVKALLESVLTAPVMKDVGALISARLGRDLEPFDIWYEGFRGRGETSEADLDKIVRKRYPTVAAFQKGIPAILGQLGFDKKTAEYLGTKIVVDPARGAGHATGAMRREDAAHLRTRVPADGMDYKGFNIAIHELGHNVEQVLSLNRMDHYFLSGVPNTAFTEGFAFAFQAHDLELLGAQKKDPMKAHLDALDAIWQTFEIGGVAMVDIEVWDWMYAHPDAGPAQLKEAVTAIAKEVWNRYFAPVIGKTDVPLLAVYSHMIDAGMYIPDYPIGGLIQFQVEDYFKKKGLAKEMERMCKIGAVTPAEWMRQAVGGPISAQPMIDAAKEAVKILK